MVSGTVGTLVPADDEPMSNTINTMELRMTKIQQFIGRIREQYLVELTREIATYNRTFNKTQIEELVERHVDLTLPPAFNTHRIDMVSSSHNYTDFTECKPETTLYFRPTTLSLNGQLKIVLEPFTWNEVDIECTRFDAHALILQQWAYHWIERNDHTERGDHGLRGCAHSISFPISKGDTCRFSVDFGSADVDCFIELMHVLCRLGVTQARVFSRYLYQ